MIWARPLTFPQSSQSRHKNFIGFLLDTYGLQRDPVSGQFSLWAVAPGLGWAIIGLTWAGDLISVMSPSLSLGLPICEMGTIPCPKSFPESKRDVDGSMQYAGRYTETGTGARGSLPLTVVQRDDMETRGLRSWRLYS